MLCDSCHQKKYGTTIKSAHLIQIVDKCEKCKQVVQTANCHCYLRTEYINRNPQPKIKH